MLSLSYKEESPASPHDYLLQESAAPLMPAVNLQETPSSSFWHYSANVYRLQGFSGMHPVGDEAKFTVHDEFWV